MTCGEESPGAALCSWPCVLGPSCKAVRTVYSSSVESVLVCARHCRHRWYLKTCSRFSFLLADRKFWAASDRWHLLKVADHVSGVVEASHRAVCGLPRAELELCRVAALPGVCQGGASVRTRAASCRPAQCWPPALDPTLTYLPSAPHSRPLPRLPGLRP